MGDDLKRVIDAASSCNRTFNESKSQAPVKPLNILGYRVSFQQVRTDPESK